MQLLQQGAQSAWQAGPRRCGGIKAAAREKVKGCCVAERKRNELNEQVRRDEDKEKSKWGIEEMCRACWPAAGAKNKKKGAAGLVAPGRCV